MFNSSGRGGLLVSVLIVLLLPSASMASDFTVANAWTTVPESYENASAYFVIQSKSSKARTIVGGSCAGCDWIEIRRVVFKDGMMSSEKMEEMEIPARGAVAFVPRGLFLSLVGLKDVDVGDKVPIELEFRDGEKLAIEATVRDE